MSSVGVTTKPGSRERISSHGCKMGHYSDILVWFGQNGGFRAFDGERLCVVCTCAATLPFLGRLKGVRFFIAFVVCYYIKVCFNTNESVYAALRTRLHAWVRAHVHEYMLISDLVPLLNL